jgi:hypothetical protein
MSCNCDLCKARALNVHPWEILWGINSIESRFFRENPGHPIYWYEQKAQLERNYAKPNKAHAA